MPRSLIRAGTVLLLALVVTMVLVVAAGCSSAGGGSFGAPETPYCANDAGMVYPASYCDGHDPMFWLWLGAWGRSYTPGQVIHVTNVQVTRIDSTDTAGRGRYGMPTSGQVSSGYRYTPPRPATSTGTSTGTSTSRPATTAPRPAAPPPAAPAAPRVTTRAK